MLIQKVFTKLLKRGLMILIKTTSKNMKLIALSQVMKNETPVTLIKTKAILIWTKMTLVTRIMFPVKKITSKVRPRTIMIP